MREAEYKILVVDDEPDVESMVLQCMRSDIRSQKCEFVFVRDGIEAIDMLSADDEIDMVLTDINMPRMDGLALLQRISEMDSDIRSVIISAYDDMYNIRTAMNRGAFDFITKPFDFADLRVTIARALNHLAEYREVVASHDRLVALQNESNVAGGMQKSILPTEFPDGEYYQIYADMEPARNIGGDFFDIVELQDDRLGIAIADVSDKGVPAALFMMTSRTWMKGAAAKSSPGLVLREVNDLLYGENEAQMFVTLLYAIYNPETGEFTYASGGHDAPLVVRPDGSTELLPLTGGVALGVMPDLEYGQRTVTLEHGETIVLYTDGVTEAMNYDGEQFGAHRLREVFADTVPEDSVTAAQMVFESVRSFANGAAQSDDITCLTLRRS